MTKNKPTQKEIEVFVSAYLACGLWSSNDESDDSGGNPLDDNYSTNDFSDDATSLAQEECTNFVRDNYSLLLSASDDFSQHGHDFWLTRNGHGAGFWDRGYGEVGDTLSDMAKRFGERNIFVGDDGKLYFM